MARRKNWLECVSLKHLNKTKSNNLDISWSSSSSDTEDTIFYKYRKKMKKSNDLNSDNHFKVKWEITPSKTNNCSQDLSPIIGQNQLELSPILNKTSSDNGVESPVIGGNSKIKLWKKHKDSKKLVHSESFSDKFKLLNTDNDNMHYNISGYSSSSEPRREHIQFSEKISGIDINLKTQLEKRNTDIDLIESVSEASNDILSEASQKISIDCSSPSKSCSSPDKCSFTISQFSTSQESQNCFINDRSGNNNSDSATNISSENSRISPPLSESVLYYHKVPRKKKYKKGRLMNELQKALKNKTCNISMWQHELYLGKIDFGQDFIQLQVLKIIVEFSCRICICQFINTDTHEDTNKKCILVLDFSIHHGVQCLQILKVYKPYSTSNVNYCNENFCCYYNVSKLLFD